MTMKILALVISLLMVGLSTAKAQTGQTQEAQAAKQSLDDIWAVVEYPQGKEVTVDLLPTSLAPNASGRAKVTRGQNETAISLEVTGIGEDTNTYHLYAVDSLGNASLLTEARFGGESSTISARTPLSRFMLILSPDSDLTGIESNTRILLRSGVPEGLTVIPRETGTGAVMMPISLRTEPDMSDYDAPTLGITSLPKGKESQMRARYSTGFETTRSSILIKPLKRGASRIKILLHLPEQRGEGGSRYVLWAFSPASSYSMLGQFSTTKKNGELKIETETDLRDFGLFITIEGEDTLTTPAGPVIATIVR